MSTKTATKYHFSPTLRDWAKCEATIKCRLDHVGEQEYIAIQNDKIQEATLLNSNLAEAEIAYIDAKTGMDLETIHETLRELRREGSRLPDPTVAEIEAFLEQERFKVEHDPTLTNKERRAILKSLKEAQKELDNEQQKITGGILHAWKNGLIATLAKIRKPVMIGALAGGLAFGLAACAPATQTTPGPEKPDTVAEEVITEECVTDIQVSGDVIAGEPATNSAGEYCTIKINPESSALVYDKTKVDPALYEIGYTDAQLEEVQKHAVTTAVETLLDNPTVGLPSEETLAWVKTEGGAFLKPEIQELSLGGQEEIKQYDVFGLSYVTNPPAVHDGGPRFTQVNVEVQSIGFRTTTSTDTFHPEDVEVVMKITSTQRVDGSKYNQWKGEFLTLMDKGEFADKVQELEQFDREAPVFIDYERQQRIGYEKSDIEAGNYELVRAISTKVDDPINYIPYN